MNDYEFNALVEAAQRGIRDMNDEYEESYTQRQFMSESAFELYAADLDAAITNATQALRKLVEFQG